MIVLLATAEGAIGIDLETEEVVPGEPFDVPEPPSLNLPRVVAAAESGSTVAVVVDARPPILISYDAGTTWRESGRGLQPGVAIAIAESNPDVLAYAALNRVYVSSNGGVFWTALPFELPDIEAVALRES
jgi:hypothetical protein